MTNTQAVYRLATSSIVAISMWGALLVILVGIVEVGNPTQDGGVLFSGLLLFSALQVAYLACQRAEFTHDSFTYRRWAYRFSVPYHCIADIEWIIAPRTYFSAAIYTVDGARHTLPLKLFPQEVAQRLAEILKKNQGRS
jgi:hypothetical protein